MRLLRSGGAITRPEPISLSQPTPGRGSRFGLVLFLGVPFLLCVATAFLQTGLLPAEVIPPAAVPQPAAVEVQLTPAVSDYVANQERRLELENEQAQISLALTEMARQIEQADQQQQLALLRRQQELEIERTALQLTADAWAESQRQKEAEAQLAASIRATDQALTAQQELAAAELARHTAVVEREKTLTSLTASLVPLAYVGGIIGLLFVVYLAVVSGLLVYAWYLNKRAWLLALPAPTVPHTTPPAPANVDVMGIDELMAEFVQAATPPPPSGRPVRPTSGSFRAVPNNSEQFGTNSTRGRGGEREPDIQVYSEQFRPVQNSSGYELFDGQAVKLPWSVAEEPGKWQQKYIVYLWRVGHVRRSVTAIASHCYKGDGKRASKKQEAWVRGVLEKNGIVTTTDEMEGVR